MLLSQVSFLHLSSTFISIHYGHLVVHSPDAIETGLLLASIKFARYYWHLLMTSSRPSASETGLLLTFDRDPFASETGLFFTIDRNRLCKT